MQFAAIRRLLDAGGVAILYGFLHKTFKSPSEINPLMTQWSSDDQKKKILQLKTFQKNLVYEGNELIENMNHTLFQELQRIRDSSSYDSTQQESELEKWAAKYTKLEIPLLRREQSHDPRINDKLRTLSSQELQMILTPNQPHRSQSTNQLVQKAVEQFYRLEDEAIHRFTNQQLRTSDAIKSFRSRVIAESKYGDYVAVLNALAQLAACQSFLLLTNQLLPGSGNLIHVPTPPRSKFATFLFLIPITAILYSGPLLGSLLPAPSLPGSIPMIHHTPKIAPNLITSPPQIKHIPHSGYESVHSLPLHPPCTDRDDIFKPWSVFINLIVPPVIEGYIFRKLLLNTLLSSTSPLKAHFLVGVAATACAAGVDSENTSIYQIKHTLSAAYYDTANPPIQTQQTISVPTLPSIIQLTHFVTRRFYLSIMLHITVLFSNRLDYFLQSPDTLFSPIHSVLYDPICRLSGFFDRLSFGPLVSLLKILNRIFHPTKPDQKPSLEDVHKDIAKKYLKFLQIPGEEEVKSLRPEDVFSLRFSIAQILVDVLLKRKPLMPPKLKELQQNRVVLPTFPFSHRQESGYVYEIFQDDRLGAFAKFSFDTKICAIEGLSHDKGEFKYIEANALLLPHVIAFDPSLLRQFKQRLFFWDETATEDELLDLIQETNAHVLEKALRSVDKYRHSRGAWLCLELQGQEEVTEDDLKEYYSDLEKYVLVLIEREEYLYTYLYGLSPHRLKGLIQSRGRDYPAVLELAKSWDHYFESEEFTKKIRMNGNPLMVYRPSLSVKQQPGLREREVAQTDSK
jgi:hypothetical protein